MSKLVREDVLIAVPHSSFFPRPWVACVRGGVGTNWVPVVFYRSMGPEVARWAILEPSRRMLRQKRSLDMRFEKAIMTSRREVRIECPRHRAS